MKKEIKLVEKEVARRLRAARTKADMSQQDLADACGVDRKTINRIENGHFSPNLNTLTRICSVMETKISVFLKGI